jgi:hypothetical protein
MSIEVESQEDMVGEALRIFKAAKQAGVTLRLVGGIAFRLKCPSSLAQNLKRSYQDIDFVGHEHERRRIMKLFGHLGYIEPKTMINALNPYRLILSNPEKKLNVDIFLDVFEMSHTLRLKKRIDLDEPTIPLADLLLTKLQAFEFTEREYRDVFALLKDYELTDRDGREGINANHIAKLCGKDWGLYTTVLLNLDRLSGNVDSHFSNSEDQKIVFEKLKLLKETIVKMPKSLKWELRAIIGKRLKWYEIPEEIQTHSELMFAQ